jgi:hypothetical protein
MGDRPHAEQGERRGRLARNHFNGRWSVRTVLAALVGDDEGCVEHDPCASLTCDKKGRILAADERRREEMTEMGEMPVQQWVKIDDVSQEIRDEPWSLYWAEFKSGTEEYERFLHDPLAHFKEVFDGVEDDWRITTVLANHERPMNITSHCWPTFVFPETKTIVSVAYKH